MSGSNSHDGQTQGRATHPARPFLLSAARLRTAPGWHPIRGSFSATREPLGHLPAAGRERSAQALRLWSVAPHRRDRRVITHRTPIDESGIGRLARRSKDAMRWGCDLVAAHSFPSLPSGQLRDCLARCPAAAMLGHAARLVCNESATNARHLRIDRPGDTTRTLALGDTRLTLARPFSSGGTPARPARRRAAQRRRLLPRPTRAGGVCARVRRGGEAQSVARLFVRSRLRTRRRALGQDGPRVLQQRAPSSSARCARAIWSRSSCSNWSVATIPTPLRALGLS
jgi:hypothetical protein